MLDVGPLGIHRCAEETARKLDVIAGRAVKEGNKLEAAGSCWKVT